jgi:uncharacterized membrane protein YphA (DoxX/SURF4 family)
MAVRQTVFPGTPGNRRQGTRDKPTGLYISCIAEINASISSFVAYGVYIGEVLAPLLLIAGLWTRAAAAVVAVNLLFALLLVHTADLFSLTKTGGWALELQALYLVSAIAVALTSRVSEGLMFSPDEMPATHSPAMSLHLASLASGLRIQAVHAAEEPREAQ